MQIDRPGSEVGYQIGADMERVDHVMKARGKKKYFDFA